MLGIVRNGVEAVRSIASSSTPSIVRIDFTPTDGSMLVEAQIDGKRAFQRLPNQPLIPFVMAFDTGASVTLLGKNHLQDLGIQPPSGPPDYTIGGVGGSGSFPAWKHHATIQVGSLVRKNFEIAVADHLDTAILGQDFIKGFDVTINNVEHCIQLSTKAASARTSTSINSGYSVPFENDGDKIIVSVDVEGRTIKMCLDTGANGSCFDWIL